MMAHPATTVVCLQNLVLWLVLPQADALRYLAEGRIPRGATQRTWLALRESLADATDRSTWFTTVHAEPSINY